MIASQQDVALVEVYRLTANIEVQPALRGELRKQPRLTASVHAKVEG